MDRTLKILQARQAIEETVFGYAEAIDAGELERLNTLLAACTVTLPDGTELKGGPAVASHYAELVIFYDADENAVDYGSGTPCTPLTKHVSSNLQYDFDVDLTQVEVRSYFTVYQGLGGENSIIAGGRYVDLFKNTMHGWQMTSRRLHLDHAGDMSRHTRRAIDGD